MLAEQKNRIIVIDWTKAMVGDASLDWRPTASFEILRQRAAFLKKVRQFFEQKEVLEVETPLLVSYSNPDFHIEHFSVDSNPQLFLHSSPELAMKRLLAAGSGPIFQITKVFRKNEFGRLHRQEFTMLEWYQTGITYHQLMDAVHELLEFVGIQRSSTKLTYLQAFQQYSGLDIAKADESALKKYVDNAAIELVGFNAISKDLLLELILTEKVEPHLGQDCMTFLYDYPASQAAMAKVRDGVYPVAERFELYFQGVEIANGYQELTDSTLLKQRFEHAIRSGLISTSGLDPQFFAAIDSGLPECSGVAIGLDRLFMLYSGCSKIQQVMSL